MNAKPTSGDQGVGRFLERLSKLRARSGARIALVAVVLFLVFDFTALALNFWLSYRIETQAVNINLAGRQRMLSQRMVKVLLQIEDQRALDQGSGDLMQELARTYRLFDNTLESFANGGVTTAALGAEIELAPLVGANNRALINNALSLWKPYREAVGALLYTQAGDSDTLQRAVTLARSSNLELLDLMNRLTTELERQTQREARQIRFFQGARLRACSA
ncbi:type IV pili methyl-accepting chemotaxis transducer N-terminal domain-containing protein [Marinobacterium litorale]|uniref:type IV pili methyl-accepting chemotaxis transducer N-terminal domain-containing protein n=1 Tax=Marinobacterium litorale TaxID=404770 RepID=UPI0004271CA4|nr:type IV pili methyl-accepting chemotaxis transducer N-terminal domain-containing protein [Marinobacterium litorale]